MADYYSILARAVSGLATNNAQARQELYEHARTFFIAQLRRHDPQISTLETIQESMAFETAILKVEAESRSADYVPLRDASNIPDFASLLREPGSPAPSSNDICLGISPLPSHLIPRKLQK
jgi:hypothetical protein